MRNPRLSSRTAWPSTTTRLHDAIGRARARGASLLDLTISNPTAVGLEHPPSVYEALAPAQARRYDPDPLGLPSARAAVAAYYAERGHPVDPDRVCLFASTSEAYARLFTVLCDPGDAVAVPAPGYPLLDHLCDAVAVDRRPYRLRYDAQWVLDAASLHAALAGTDTRAVVVVSPSNPTGAVANADDRRTFVRGCAEAGAVLVVDEVFADFPLDTPPAQVRFMPADVPSVVLSGLSKVAALPQVKVSWAILGGPEAFVVAIRSRLEILADAFLSVSTPAQLALPALLRAAPPVQDRIRTRTRANLDTLRRLVTGQPIDVLPVGAGWSALVRLPALWELDDEGWALAMLERDVVCNPGYLFDLTGPPYAALSLLTPPDVWTAGLTRMVDLVAARCEAPPGGHSPPRPPRAVPLWWAMGDDTPKDPLGNALQQAQANVHREAEDATKDLEPVLRSALAKSGLTWELLGHRVELGEHPTLHAEFRLCHPASGKEEVREFPIPLTSPNPDEKTLRNALDYLWSHALKDLLSVQGPERTSLTGHLQPTLKIPKIEDE